MEQLYKQIYYYIFDFINKTIKYNEKLFFLQTEKEQIRSKPDKRTTPYKIEAR